MAFLIANLLTQGIYTGAINTISSFTLHTVHLANSIYNHQNADVNVCIKSLDIERRLKMMNSVIKVISKRAQNISDEQLLYLSQSVYDSDQTENPIALSLYYLKETIAAVNEDLNKIKEKVERHQTKWFNTWRTMNIEPLLDNLKQNSSLLDLRFNDLTKISIFLRESK
jgi:hypothetical protein